MKFHLVALQANLSYCCLDLTTTKIPTLALPFCRKTTMLQRDKSFTVQGYTCILEQNCSQGNLTKWTTQVRWEQKVPVTHTPCSWKPIEKSPAASIQPAWSLPVTLLQNWCNWTALDNRKRNNHYWSHSLLYRRVSNPAAHIQANALHASNGAVPHRVF